MVQGLKVIISGKKSVKVITTVIERLGREVWEEFFFGGVGRDSAPIPSFAFGILVRRSGVPL